MKRRQLGTSKPSPRKLTKIPTSMDLSWGASLYDLAHYKAGSSRYEFAKIIAGVFDEMRRLFESGDYEAALEAAYLAGACLGKHGGAPALKGGRSRGRQKTAEKKVLLQKIIAASRAYKASDEAQQQYSESVYVANKLRPTIHPETARRHLNAISKEKNQQ